MGRDCYILRVFTAGDAGGNHLGVVTDVAGLDAAAMQAIATDLGFSESIFIDGSGRDVPHVRIFTPALELPFAGHPLVGAAWVLGVLGGADCERLSCGIGEVACSVEGETVWVHVPMAQDVAEAPEAAAIATEAGLPVPARAWWVRVPAAYLLLEVASVAEVAGAEPDMGVLAAHVGTYLFTRRGDDVRARFFAPSAGVPEDPATGSAAVALAAALRASGEDAGSVFVAQGAEIGHPSRIALRWGAATASIGGTVRRDEVRRLET